MSNTRKFHHVKEEHRKHPLFPSLPRRSDPGSAGYDFFSPIDFTLHPGESKMIMMDVKVEMLLDEVLYLFVRSSMGTKGVNLRNKVGVIDSTYFENENNDGNIGLKLSNESDIHVSYKRGERIGQGVFHKYLITVDDNPLNGTRTGGIGSSGK